MSRATIPEVVLPQSSASRSARYNNDQHIGTPPFMSPGVDSSGFKAKSMPDTHNDSRVASNNHSLNMEFTPPSVYSNTILEPRPGCDVVALIFLLLLLPQSWSCLILTSYILSGSFKSLCGKVISKVLVRSDSCPHFFIEEPSKPRAFYYRSELLGEFLQLFSINSFILLLCRFTFPRAWLRYLNILAKSVIAGRLVGTYSTGSTTYVSVVSNNVTSTGSVTTTTTTNTGNIPHSSKVLPNLTSSPFGSFMTGFAFVLVADYIKERTSDHLEIVSRLSTLFLSSSGELFNYVSLHSASGNFVQKNSSYYEESQFSSTKASWMCKVLIRVLIKVFRISEKSVHGITHLSQNFDIIVNFAYLVLCIHVIGLTISPFLRRVFIFKDYSETLDHLACLTPYVPYGGLKKNGVPLSTYRDPSSDSVVVINMEQPRPYHSKNSTPFEIKVDPEVSKVSLKGLSQDHIKSTTTENFKSFCMRPPAMKSLVPGSRQSHTRTIVDRKRSNSFTSPSTTIMDKYFTVSIQPLWAWAAAIKILLVEPMLFSRPYSKPEADVTSAKGLQLALSSVGKSELIFQITDQTFRETLVANLSVQVNGTPWLFVDILQRESFMHSEEDTFISVYGLSSSCLFKVDFFDNDVAIGHHIVSTASSSEFFNRFSKGMSAAGLLRSSLTSSLSDLVEMRAGFKKEKREESKRITELRRQIDALMAKSEKYGSTQAIESRIGGKLKGLQNSVTQLENDIDELGKTATDLTIRDKSSQRDYRGEESKLKLMINEQEKLIRECDTKSNNFKLEAKGVCTEREVADSRLRRMEDKLSARQEELLKTSAEVKSLKRDLVTKIQKRQEGIHDRIECMVRKINEASEDLRDELWSFSYRND